MNCSLNDIRLIVVFHEAYYVGEDGAKGELLLGGPPRAYKPQILEFYCTQHDCSFKQWRAVRSHLEGEGMLE